MQQTEWKTRVWLLPGDGKVILIVISPQIEDLNEIEKIQDVILEYIKCIGKSAEVRRTEQRQGKSCFSIETCSYWDGSRKAVEIGLQIALGIPYVN